MPDLKANHVDLLVNHLANSADNALEGTPQDFLRNLVASAHLPRVWTRGIAGRWTGNVNIDARRLIDWSIGKGVNPENPNYTALGAVLYAWLKQQPSPEVARDLVALVLGYGLIFDKEVTDDLRIRYNAPGAVGAPVPGAAEYGPEIDWLGPGSEIELQGFFTADPPWQDVGFLLRAMASTSSVCRVEIGDVRGTGFLIAKGLVLTNYHVMRPTPAHDLDASLGKTVLRFGCFTVSGGDASDGKKFQATRIVEQSPVNELDFALLEVEPKIHGEEAIQPVKLQLNSPPVKSALNLIHHPAGDTMKLSTSGNGVTGVYQDRGQIQYVTQAVGGSSGSPCFNDDWEVVALHHAQRARAFGSVREGILIRSIHQRIHQHL